MIPGKKKARCCGCTGNSICGPCRYAEGAILTASTEMDAIDWTGAGHPTCTHHFADAMVEAGEYQLVGCVEFPNLSFQCAPGGEAGYSYTFPQWLPGVSYAMKFELISDPIPGCDPRPIAFYLACTPAHDVEVEVIIPLAEDTQSPGDLRFYDNYLSENFTTFNSHFPAAAELLLLGYDEFDCRNHTISVFEHLRNHGILPGMEIVSAKLRRTVKAASSQALTFHAGLLAPAYSYLAVNWSQRFLSAAWTTDGGEDDVIAGSESGPFTLPTSIPGGDLIDFDVTDSVVYAHESTELDGHVRLLCWLENSPPATSATPAAFAAAKHPPEEPPVLPDQLVLRVRYPAGFAFWAVQWPSSTKTLCDIIACSNYDTESTSDCECEIYGCEIDPLECCYDYALVGGPCCWGLSDPAGGFSLETEYACDGGRHEIIGGRWIGGCDLTLPECIIIARKRVEWSVTPLGPGPGAQCL